MASNAALLPPSVSMADLKRGEKLGSGGQGDVYAIDGRPELALKLYSRTGVGADSLQALVDLLARLPTSVQGELLARTTWPLATVRDAGQTVGIVMTRLPDRFYSPIGGRLRPRDSSYAIYPPAPMWAGVRQPSPEQRWELARLVAGLFGTFHRAGVVYGDLSHANVAWDITPNPDVFLMDCDAIHLSGLMPALSHAHTIDWDDPQHPDRSNFDSDRYKLALFVGRMIKADPHLRPGTTIEVIDPSAGRSRAARVQSLFRRAGGRRGTRPSAHEWLMALSP